MNPSSAGLQTAPNTGGDSLHSTVLKHSSFLPALINGRGPAGLQLHPGLEMMMATSHARALHCRHSQRCVGNHLEGRAFLLQNRFKTDPICVPPDHTGEHHTLYEHTAPHLV